MAHIPGSMCGNCGGLILARSMFSVAIQEIVYCGDDFAQASELGHQFVFALHVGWRCGMEHELSQKRSAFSVHDHIHIPQKH
jgi:hypothetical protein